MIFDILFGLFVFAMIGIAPGPRADFDPVPQPEQQFPPVPDYITDMALEELACFRNPDPTRVLRAMLDEGLIRATDRRDIESFSCFPVPGGMELASIQVNSVCGGVLDPEVNARNSDLYPPNEVISDPDRYQVLAFGTNDDLSDLLDWYNGMYGPRTEYGTGAAEAYYALDFSQNEIFCDDLVVDEVTSMANQPAELLQEPPTPSDLAPEAPALGQSSAIADMAMELLACDTPPDPTPLLRAMLEQGLIDTANARHFESLSCYAIKGGISISDIDFQSVCASVAEPEMIENPDLYRLERGYGAYPLIAFGTGQVELPAMQDWYAENFGKQNIMTNGVQIGMFDPVSGLSEAYCSE